MKFNTKVKKEKVLRDGQDLSGTKIALNVDAILKHDISLSFHFNTKVNSPIPFAEKAPIFK
jgi:hypothetical protein